MIVDEIRRAYYAEPFRPFTLHLMDGRTITVDEPFHVGIDPNGRAVGVALPDGTIDVLCVESIVKLESAAAISS